MVLTKQTPRIVESESVAEIAHKYLSVMLHMSLRRTFICKYCLVNGNRKLGYSLPFLSLRSWRSEYPNPDATTFLSA